MRPTVEARYGITALLALQLATSLVGVALLGRMSPAVDKILKENVYSTEAVEHMLSALHDRDAAEMDEALERARGNITEPEEVAILDAIEAGRGAALAGDAGATKEAIAQLRRLGAVNRASMQRADQAARRMGLAGAWAMALFGFVGFLVSLGVRRRAEARLIRPVREVDAVLRAARAGDSRRRCAPQPASPQGGRLVANLNWLLDRREETAGDEREVGGQDCLLAMLDRVDDRPVLAGNAAGVLLAMNRLALGAEHGWRDVAAAVSTGEEPDGWTVTRRGDGWIAEGPAQT